MKINSAFYSKLRGLLSRKGTSLKVRLIIYSIFMLITIFFLNLLLYYSNTSKVYLEQLEIQNASRVRQIARSFDLAIDQMQSNVFQATYYDQNFQKLISSYDDSVQNKMLLLNYISNIVNLSEEYESVYLALPKYDVVFTTDLGSKAYENFYDSAPFNELLDKNASTSIIGPRTISNLKHNQQFIS